MDLSFPKYIQIDSMKQIAERDLSSSKVQTNRFYGVDCLGGLIILYITKHLDSIGQITKMDLSFYTSQTYKFHRINC